MFENLTDKFTNVFRNLRGIGKISEKNIESVAAEVKFALLEADVNYKVVKQFVSDIKERALGQEVLQSLMPDQQFIKIVNDELITLMKSGDTELAKSQVAPTIIMLIGLQGVGKTTVAAKIATYLKKQDKTCMLVACDVQRPAAIEQLRVLSDTCGCLFYSSEKEKNPVRIAEDAVTVAQEKAVDYLIVDTAGRLDINEELMEEIKQMKLAVKPHEVMYVADAMVGQTSVEVAKKFNDTVGIDSIFVTKMDGDARGGVALSVKTTVGRPIKFIGVGEKIEDIEPFYPDRMASRILGMGDVVSLVEKVQQNFDENATKKLEKKIKKKGLDLNDFLGQLQQIKKMGSIKDIISMMPGAGQLKNLPVDEKQIVRIEAIINSMTKYERSNPEIINGSRRKRIANGSGTTVRHINQMLKQFTMMNKMLKKMGSMKMPGGMGKMPFGF